MWIELSKRKNLQVLKTSLSCFGPFEVWGVTDTSMMVLRGLCKTTCNIKLRMKIELIKRKKERWRLKKINISLCFVFENQCQLMLGVNETYIYTMIVGWSLIEAFGLNCSSSRLWLWYGRPWLWNGSWDLERGELDWVFPLRWGHVLFKSQLLQYWIFFFLNKVYHLYII